jgi:hypothetical protein
LIMKSVFSLAARLIDVENASASVGSAQVSQKRVGRSRLAQ